MKGISAVIATILMLLITIALAGLALSYIFGYWGLRTGKQLSFVGTAICVVNNEPSNDTISAIVQNSGTAEFYQADLTIFKVNSSGQFSINKPYILGGLTILAPYNTTTLTFNDTDCVERPGTRMCTYRVSWPGGSQDISVVCTG